MSELLEVYDLHSNLLNLQERREFYQDIKAEFSQTGTITKKVKSIRLLLMNSEWRIYLQKRSKHKKANPWKYDKTIGWHVIAGESYTTTVTKECAEELWFPALFSLNMNLDQQ